MSRIKSNFDYLFVIIYFSGAIFFQTRLSENVLLNIHGNTKFWDTYFEIIYYGIFAVACLLFYKNKIAASIKKIKITDFKYIGIALIFIIITMVASAIILSYNGIGESANQEAINNYISDYGIITLLVVIILGPLVEEIVSKNEFLNSTAQWGDGIYSRTVDIYSFIQSCYGYDSF